MKYIKSKKLTVKWTSYLQVLICKSYVTSQNQLSNKDLLTTNSYDSLKHLFPREKKRHIWMIKTSKIACENKGTYVKRRSVWQ